MKTTWCLVAALVTVSFAGVCAPPAIPLPPVPAKDAAKKASKKPTIPLPATNTPAPASTPAAPASAATPPPPLPLPAPAAAKTPPAPVAPPPVVAPNFSKTTSPSPAPAPAPAPAAASDAPSVDVLDDAPLFAVDADPAKGEERKQLYVQAGKDESAAQDLIRKIDDLKSERLSAHLSLDAELDTFFQECGLERGRTLAVIANVLEAIDEELAGGGSGDPDAEESVGVEDRKKILGDLEATMTMLQEKETALVDALKVLSTSTGDLSDKAADIISKRTEIRGVADAAIAKTLAEDIAQALKDIQAGHDALMAPGGAAKAVDDALSDVRASLASAKSSFGTAKAKIATLDADLKKHSEQKPIDLSKEVAPQKSEATPAPSKKKRSSTIASQFMGLVRGTFLEKPVGMLVRGVYSVIDFFTPLAQDLSAPDVKPDAPEKKKAAADTVLSKIEEERMQAKEKVKELLSKKKELENKASLLDRLEVERMMQLDRHEDVEAALDEAYERSDRELTWKELLMRLVWKLYATVRRIGVRLYRSLSQKADEAADAVEPVAGSEAEESGTPEA
jgi:hypothetical protein